MSLTAIWFALCLSLEHSVFLTGWFCNESTIQISCNLFSVGGEDTLKAFNLTLCKDTPDFPWKMLNKFEDHP